VRPSGRRHCSDLDLYRLWRADERTRTAYPCSSYECAVSGCCALHRLANTALLSGFLFPALLTIAGCCVRVRVKLGLGLLAISGDANAKLEIPAKDAPLHVADVRCLPDAIPACCALWLTVRLHQFIRPGEAVVRQPRPLLLFLSLEGRTRDSVTSYRWWRVAGRL
jgi:hypothetical protein